MWIILEVQSTEGTSHYNGNVWGPYKTRKDAEWDVPILEYETKNHPAGKFIYMVRDIKRVQ